MEIQIRIKIDFHKIISKPQNMKKFKFQKPIIFAIITTVSLFANFSIIRPHYQNMYKMCLVEKINLNGKCIDDYRSKDKVFEFLFNNGLIGDS